MSKKNKKNQKRSQKKKTKTMTEKAIQANQQNGQKGGTGSPEISCMNNLQSGLHSRNITAMAWETQQAYEAFYQGFMQRLAPGDVMETFYAEQAIEKLWISRRGAPFEAELRQMIKDPLELQDRLEKNYRQVTRL